MQAQDAVTETFDNMGDESSDADYTPPSFSTIELTEDDIEALHDGGLDEHTESFFSHQQREAQETAVPPTAAPQQTTGEKTMAQNIDESLKQISKIGGFVAAALVDSGSGMALGTTGGNSDFDIDIAAAANTDVVAAKLRAAEALGLEDAIEDILITLSTQYHLICPLPKNPAIFVYVCVDRNTANLALARLSVTKIAKNLEIQPTRSR